MPTFTKISKLRRRLQEAMEHVDGCRGPRSSSNPHAGTVDPETARRMGIQVEHRQRELSYREMVLSRRAAKRKKAQEEKELARMQAEEHARLMIVDEIMQDEGSIPAS